MKRHERTPQKYDAGIASAMSSHWSCTPAEMIICCTGNAQMYMP
jgi:hypothetical protein